MKPVYTAYAKAINGTTFYFVKSFQTFPEYKTVEPILEGYGMHPNFEQACNIAQVFDKEIQQQLVNELSSNSASSSVLPVYPSVARNLQFTKKTDALSISVKTVQAWIRKKAAFTSGFFNLNIEC